LIVGRYMGTTLTKCAAPSAWHCIRGR
jgi:hypothetical protein